MKNDYKNGNKYNGKSSKFSMSDQEAVNQFEQQSPSSTFPKELQSKKNKPAKTGNTRTSTIPTLLKGRYICNCETRKHALINNCLNCGRIVCEQEGSGPCYICGNLVCTLEEQIQLDGDAAKSAKLYEHLLMKKKPKGLEEALQHRDKLLDFDKNTRKHTHVFDDDSDYFCASNPWLTLEQRDLMRKQEEEFFNNKYESQKFKKITLDLKSLQILNEVKINRNAFEDATKNAKVEDNTAHSQSLNENIVDHLIDPFFSALHFKFKRTLKSDSSGKLNSRISESRVMDTEIQRIADAGYCISIHQPWASFLVHGIRTGEGRTWYTSYRGKLWIASSNSRVPRSEIEKCENSYRYIKDNVKFPRDYPTGCLLGCVDLIDCLTQEQYRQEFPDGEIEDPYVFICENPQLLGVIYPIRGKPNIYKLDEKIHKAAALSLKMIEEK